LELTKLSIEMLSIKTSAVADIFTALGESIGAAMGGAENAFDGLLSAFLDVIKKIGTTLITFGSILVFTKLLSGLGVQLLLAGTAIVAISSAMKTSRENTRKYSESSKMAQGGVVPPGYPNDSYPARLSSGEMVIPPKKLPDFERKPIEIILGGELKAKGRDLVYIVNEENRRVLNTY
jgi:hypothetical protein